MHQLFNHPISARYLAINNLISCIYITIIFLWLHWTDTLYEIGHYKNTYLQWILLLAELAKYAVFTHVTSKELKKHESKKFRFHNLFKSVYTVLGVLVIFHIVPILFGAPFFSKQHETFTFAATMTILTVVPCCLYLGPEKSLSIVLTLTSVTSNEVYNKFKLTVQLTYFAAWLGAAVIPLDWNRPYQSWPIPCILAALSGIFLGNLLLAVSYFLQKRIKKNFKVEC